MFLINLHYRFPSTTFIHAISTFSHQEKQLVTFRFYLFFTAVALQTGNGLYFWLFLFFFFVRKTLELSEACVFWCWWCPNTHIHYMVGRSGDYGLILRRQRKWKLCVKVNVNVNVKSNWLSLGAICAGKISVFGQC